MIQINVFQLIATELQSQGMQPTTETIEAVIKGSVAQMINQEPAFLTDIMIAAQSEKDEQIKELTKANQSMDNALQHYAQQAQKKEVKTQNMVDLLDKTLAQINPEIFDKQRGQKSNDNPLSFCRKKVNKPMQNDRSKVFVVKILE